MAGFWRRVWRTLTLRGDDGLEAPVERRGYDGAARGRRYHGWTPTNGSANSEVALGAPELRKRARDLVRNNRYAAKAQRTLVSNLVGDGFTLRVATGSAALDAQVLALWAAWGKRCEASGVLGWGAVQDLVASGLFESGEIFVRQRPRRSADGLPVPLQLQVIEAEQCDASKNELLTGRDGSDAGRVVQGIQLDALDRRSAYWLYPYHPGDTVVPIRGGYGESRPVPAAEIAHVYEMRRPGQLRGVPWLAPVIVGLRDLDDYRDAELVRKKIEACVSAFIYGGQGGGEDGLGPEVAATEIDSDVPVEMMEPGMLVHVRHGKDVKFSTPGSIGGFAEYMRTELQGDAAGIGMTYELLSGDLSQVNYSSIRAGLIEFRRLMSALQLHVFVPQFLERVWEWWIAAAVASGALPEADYRATWVPPRFEEVDREKEAQADALEILHLLSSRTDIAARRGTTWRETAQELADEVALAGKLGLQLPDSVSG